MGRERESVAWNHTSAILALIANTNRSPKRKAFKSSEFHPYAKPAKQPEFSDLKSFLGR